MICNCETTSRVWTVSPRCYFRHLYCWNGLASKRWLERTTILPVVEKMPSEATRVSTENATFWCTLCGVGRCKPIAQLLHAPDKMRCFDQVLKYLRDFDKNDPEKVEKNLMFWVRFFLHLYESYMFFYMFFLHVFLTCLISYIYFLHVFLTSFSYIFKHVTSENGVPFSTVTLRKSLKSEDNPHFFAYMIKLVNHGVKSRFAGGVNTVS